MASDKGKLFRVVVILALLLFLVVLPAILLSNILAVFEIFGYAVDKLNSIGLNRWFAKAIVIVMIGPFVWGLNRMLSLRSRKRMVGSVVVSAYVAAFYVVMGFGTKGHIVDKYLQLRADGIQYDIIDHGGINPFRPPDSLIPMTTEIQRTLDEYDSDGDGRLNLEDALIHPITREGLVYYTVDDNNLIVIWDQGGADPYTGEERRRITPEVARMFLEQDNRLAEAERRETATADSIQRENETIAREQAADAQRARDLLASRRKYLRDPDFSGLGANDIALFISEKSRSAIGGYSSTIESSLGSLLGRSKNVVSFPFTDAFVDEGYLDELVGGNTSILDRLQLKRRSGELAIFAINAANPGPTVAGMKTVEIPCRITVVGMNGAVRLNEPLVGKGAGSTDDQCQRQASSDIEKKLASMSI